MILNIRNDEDAIRAFRKLISLPDAEGVNVQPMLKKGVEVVLGVAENEQFGSYVMFGLGGIFVEVLRDVSFRLLPVTRKEAEKMVKSIRGYKILSGYRGFRGDMDSLINLIVKINELVENENILEMDLNPIFLYEKGYSVADARIVRGKRKKFDYTLQDLTSLFYPRSIAVIGASRTFGKPGYNIVLNLKNHGFRGRIYLVNPNAKEILGFKCYSSVLEIPEDVDLGIIAVPSKIVPDVMRDCAEKKGIKGVVIVSSGFSEEGEKWAEYEKEVLRIAKENGIRIFGPNTTGIFNTDNGLISSFAIIPRIRKGDISIIAQTGLFLGIMMDSIMSNHPSIGFSKIVGMGNKIDVEDYEVINFLEKDEKTKVIGIYMEGIRNGRAFYEIAKNSRKAIILFKSGRTEFGEKAAFSHTASICGDDDIFNAVCEQANIIRVESFNELVDVAKAISFQQLPSGERVGIIHYTGSGCVQGADAAYFNNLKLAELSERTIKKIEEITPEWHNINNPLDIWPSIEYFGINAYDVAIEEMLRDKNVDSLVVSVLVNENWEGMIYKPELERFKKFGKPLYFVIEGSRDLVFKLKNEFELKKFPVYSDVITAINVLGKVTKYAKNL